jgi:hypothetical protein
MILRVSLLSMEIGWEILNFILTGQFPPRLVFIITGKHC